MADATTHLNWQIPERAEPVYYTDFVSLINAIDAHVFMAALAKEILEPFVVSGYSASSAGSPLTQVSVATGIAYTAYGRVQETITTTLAVTNTGSLHTEYVSIDQTDAIVIKLTSRPADYLPLADISVSAAGIITAVTDKRSLTLAFKGSSKGTEVQLTTTDLTQLVSLTPTEDRNFEVLVYSRIANAETDLTLTLTWYDGSGGQKTETLNIGPVPVGPLKILAQFINAGTAGAIVLSAQAGTANNVYVSWVIRPY